MGAELDRPQSDSPRGPPPLWVTQTDLMGGPGVEMARFPHIAPQIGHLDTGKPLNIILWLFPKRSSLCWMIKKHLFIPCGPNPFYLTPYRKWRLCFIFPRARCFIFIGAISVFVRPGRPAGTQHSISAGNYSLYFNIIESFAHILHIYETFESIRRD